MIIFAINEYIRNTFTITDVEALAALSANYVPNNLISATDVCTGENNSLSVQFIFIPSGKF